MNGFLAGVGARIVYICDQTGDSLLLLLRSLLDCRWAFARPRRIAAQMKRVGNETLLIASGISLFIGMVLALQIGSALKRFEAESTISAIIAYSMIKELGPVITALLLAGRIGAAIAAEIGTMQINEEIDALHTLGISPVRYLAMPRFIACTTMLPILVIYASAVGIAGGGLVANAYFDIGWRAYLDGAFNSLDGMDLVESVVKSALFGAIVAIVACQRGFQTRSGAEGVGRAITSCVVTCFVCIIIADYFVTRFLL